MVEILPITKESILKAAEVIDQNPSLRKGRESIEYDLVLDSKRYPPILVLSEANKFLGGSVLLLSDFGSSTKKAFSILENLGFTIEKKYPMLDKQIIVDIANLCEKIATGKEDGSITSQTYSNIFKPNLKEFKAKYNETPNLFLQNQLQNFYNIHLKDANEKIDFKGFSFWGRAIYNYVWACIFFDTGHDAIPASYSPQLFILVNRYGIKFGFCYGHHLSNDDAMVKMAISDAKVFSLLKRCIESDKDLCFYNKGESEVTARPEILFGENERISIRSDNDIVNNWSKGSLLIKEFPKNVIPENIYELIDETLINLKDFYLSLLPVYINKPKNELLSNHKFDIDTISLVQNFKDSGLFFDEKILIRYVASLLSKPFVILTGLSGSGKTKLAQAFAMWICQNKSQYSIIPVGADWTNREPLLGFPNALVPTDYKWDDYGVLKLISEAGKQENENKPYFLILDEMNLSHVERYFADFLSSMESNSKIPLHSGSENWNNVPPEIAFPKNLFIVGTVNIDETTYMFSPKVLDRANVIEFRVTADDMNEYLQTNSIIDIDSLVGKGKEMAESFVVMAKDESLKPNSSDDIDILMDFFIELKKNGAEFGYRSAFEILRFMAVMAKLKTYWKPEEIIDVAIMQKLLPKVHGSRRKLEPILKTLGSLCLHESNDIESLITKIELTESDISKIKYPISFEKIQRMFQNLISNGFTSYAEA